jgi:hypothetical protein
MTLSRPNAGGSVAVPVTVLLIAGASAGTTTRDRVSVVDGAPAAIVTVSSIPATGSATRMSRATSPVLVSTTCQVIAPPTLTGSGLHVLTIV